MRSLYVYTGTNEFKQSKRLFRRDKSIVQVFCSLLRNAKRNLCLRVLLSVNFIAMTQERGPTVTTNYYCCTDDCASSLAIIGRSVTERTAKMRITRGLFTQNEFNQVTFYLILSFFYNKWLQIQYLYFTIKYVYRFMICPILWEKYNKCNISMPYYPNHRLRLSSNFKLIYKLDICHVTSSLLLVIIKQLTHACICQVRYMCISSTEGLDRVQIEKLIFRMQLKFKHFGLGKKCIFQGAFGHCKILN